MIDPNIWADPTFGKLSSAGMIMFIGLISLADDEGRLPGDSTFIASTLFPYKGLTKEQATEIRNEILSKMKSVHLYKVNDEEYIQLDKFNHYQYIKKPQPSNYPIASKETIVPYQYRTSGVPVAPNRIEKNRIEKNRKEEKPSELKNSIKYLESIPLPDKQSFLESYHVTEEELLKLAFSLKEYCTMHGKRYKDYSAFLRKAVDRDFKKKIKPDGIPLSELI